MNEAMLPTISNTKKIQPLQSAQYESSQYLLPIYGKVEQLKQQVEKTKKKLEQTAIIVQPTCSKKQLQVAINRDDQIIKLRQKYTTQLNHNTIRHANPSLKTPGNFTQKTFQKTNAKNYNKNHSQNTASAMIHFLSSNKLLMKRPMTFSCERATNAKKEQNVQMNAFLQSKIPLQLGQVSPKGQIKRYMASKQVQLPQFIPIGECTKKQSEKQYSQMQSDSQSLTSSRNQSSSRHHSSSRQHSSSYQSSKFVIVNNIQEGSKKYLRKGTRVREILLKQIQVDQNSQSGASTPALTYLKDYDQWVPTSLVQHKKDQLESIMTIIYGAKRDRHVGEVDLEKVDIIYL